MACRQACHRLTATVILASSSLSSSSSSSSAVRGCKIVTTRRDAATAFVIHIQKVCFSAPVDPKQQVDNTNGGNPDQPETATATEAPPTLTSLISKRKTAPSSSVDDDGDAKPMKITSAPLRLGREQWSKYVEKMKEGFRERVLDRWTKRGEERQHDEQRIRDPLRRQSESERMKLKEGREIREWRALASRRRGKFFIAEKDLFPANRAEVFPIVETKSLTGEVGKFPALLKDRVSVVAVFHRMIGLDMFKTWMEPFEEAMGPAPAWTADSEVKGKVPEVVYLSLIDSRVMTLLRPLIEKNMPKDWPEQTRQACFYRFGNTEELGKVLDIRSRLSLDVLLVDRMGRIRWRGSGHSTPEENEAMVRCARRLIESGEGVDDVPGAKLMARKGNKQLGAPKKRTSIAVLHG